MQSARRRQRWLVLCLAATLALSAWTYWRQARSLSSAIVLDTGPAVRPTVAMPLQEHLEKSPEEANHSAVPQAGEQTPDMARNNPEAAGDPFSVISWAPPPPPPPPPAPPPPPEQVVAPSAPPLPFRYVGRQELAAGPANAAEFYLARGAEALTVRPGTKIGDEYLFEGDDGQGMLQFVYLPLAAKQTLFTGEEK